LEAGKASAGQNALKAGETGEANRIQNALEAAHALWNQHRHEEAAAFLEQEYAKNPEAIRLGELLVFCCAHVGDWNRCMEHQIRMRTFCEQKLAESPIADFPYRFVSERFYNHFGHIGHFEFVYKLAELGLLPKYRLLIDLRSRPVNRHLFGYWMEKIPFIADGLTFHNATLDAALTLEINAVRLADGRFLSMYEYPCVAQEEWERQARPPALRLTAEDRAFGEGVLRDMGIPDGAWFVAAHARHATGCRTVNNVDISSYFEAFRAIADRGGWVLRVGDPSMPELPPMDRVVDYAHSPWKSERMDTFLLAAAKFFIGCGSGPSSIPSCFGVPVIFTNFSFFEMMPGTDQIVLPRIHCSRRSDTPVPFAEVVQTRYALAREIPLLDRSRLYPRPNTAEEIREAVEEMFARLDGTFAPPPDYADLQDRWRATYAAFTNIRGRCPVGWKYACRHRDLV
jgi:putative glycosyltransferase (TIGR04372 family)